MSDKRPGKFAFDDCDSEDHRICVLDENLEDTPKYLTHEKNGKRTDYGLVQCYVVRYGNRNLVVLGLWGCSTLGALAAVKWAIDLGKNNDPPPVGTLDEETPLEALVKIQSDTCDFPNMWKPEPVQLVQLHIGQQQ